MTILNFVTQEQLDGLDDDPSMAFMGLVNHAQRSLSSQISQLDPENENEWRHREELQRRFMNVVVAAGKRYEIEPFTSTTIPKYSDYRSSDYTQFESDLDHFITQLVIDNSIRAKKSSVEILPDSKDKIRNYIHGLRTCVENAHMTDQKKQKLLDKIDQFEAELEKRRTNILAVTMLAFELLAVPGGTWASIDITHKLITNITQAFADSKSLEDQTRKIGSSVPTKALSPPRPTAKKSGSQADLDDEIPF